MLSPKSIIDRVQQAAADRETPLLVGVRSAVESSMETLRDNISNTHFCYAMKANNDAEVLAIMKENGFGFDIASVGELEILKKQTWWGSVSERARILRGSVNSNPCNSVASMEAFVESGIDRFVVDCDEELDKLAQISKSLRCFIRVAITSRSSQVPLHPRFGATRHDTFSLALKALKSGIAVEGLSFHVGSQTTDRIDFENAFALAGQIWDDLAEEGIALRILDIGGGIPWVYRDQTNIEPAAYCRCIGQLIDDWQQHRSSVVWAEPGRVLVAGAVWLLTTVIGKKWRDRRWHYTIDDGRYGSFSGRYFTPHTFDFIPCCRREGNNQSSKGESNIYGPTCDGGDIVAEGYPIEELQIGDRLLVPNMGAYTHVGASRFNGMKTPNKIWID